MLKNKHRKKFLHAFECIIANATVENWSTCSYRLCDRVTSVQSGCHRLPCPDRIRRTVCRQTYKQTDGHTHIQIYTQSNGQHDETCNAHFRQFMASEAEDRYWDFRIIDHPFQHDLQPVHSIMVSLLNLQD